MHYSAKAFSKNDQPTIKVINDPDGSLTKALNARHRWSVEDALEVNMLYQCDHSK